MRLARLVLVASLTACADGSSAFSVPNLADCPVGTPSPSQLCGTWARDSSVVGSSLILDLRQDGDSIYGAGSFSIEAGRSGQLVVAGRYTPPNLRLTLRFDYGATASFEGAVGASLQITGTMVQRPSAPSFLSFTPQ